MLAELGRIASFVLEALGRAWPYLLLTIPLAVAVNISGAGAKLGKVLGKSPVIGVLIATAFGAVSPLCSCTVIPVIFSLLKSGVPLGPVMAFWLASPSMDPEIFLLSVNTLGSELAWWRLAATGLMSIIGGLLAGELWRRGALGQQILRDQPQLKMDSMGSVLKRWFTKKQAVAQVSPLVPLGAPAPRPRPTLIPLNVVEDDASCSTNTSVEKPLWRRIGDQTLSSTLFVLKFMLIAYLLEALIVLYVPAAWIQASLGGDGIGSVFGATLLGVPLYTTNIAALGLLGGLLDQGMAGGAALAFLIAGPTTTLPAMSAVYGIAKPRVFALYLGFTSAAALGIGLLYSYWI